MKKILLLLAVVGLCSCGSDLSDEYTNDLAGYSWYINGSHNQNIVFYKNHSWQFYTGATNLAPGALTDSYYTSVGSWEISGNTLKLKYLVSNESGATSCPYVHATYSLSDYNKNSRTFKDNGNVILERDSKHVDYTTSDKIDQSLSGTWKTDASSHLTIADTGEVFSIKMILNGSGEAIINRIDNFGNIQKTNSSTYTTNGGVITFANFSGISNISFFYLNYGTTLKFYRTDKVFSLTLGWEID